MLNSDTLAQQKKMINSEEFGKYIYTFPTAWQNIYIGYLIQQKNNIQNILVI